MQITRSKFIALLVAYLGLLLTILVVGCSTREGASETLLMSGNHSPGDLTMVTTDTSSDGYVYLEPDMSPDGTRIAFTADWPALKPPGQTPDPLPMIRQLVIVPNRVGTHPEQNLAASGARLVPLIPQFNVSVGSSGDYWSLYPLRENQKGSPTWIDDQTLLFWMNTPRGDRFFTADLSLSENIYPDLIYFEPEDFLPGGRYWQHHDPAISPDRQWLAFTRFGSSRAYPDSLESYTKQELWVMRLNEPTPTAFPVTTGVTLVGSPCWSPDGRKLAFDSTLEIIGGGAFYGTELFAIDFDTTGLAATGRVTLNRGLRRLTFTSMPEGDPITIQNTEPTYSADGSMIVFVSTRRAPSITLHERSLWRIPSDGSLDPVIAFFTRQDDINATFLPGSSNTLILSSSLGFPTEMLDRLEQEARDRIRENEPGLLEVQINELAAAERQELEYFAGVMSHIFIYRGW